MEELRTFTKPVKDAKGDAHDGDFIDEEDSENDFSREQDTFCALKFSFLAFA